MNYTKIKNPSQIEYEEILILVMEFFANHDYISEISLTEVFNFVDDIQNLMKKFNKEVKK
jgi:hypothetical protein